MAWTTYDDWLMTEAVALMSEPGYSDKNDAGDYLHPEIMARLEEIRGTLSGHAQDIGQVPKIDPATGQIVTDENGQTVYQSWDEKISDLLGQFEQSRVQGEQFTNQQINALLGGTGGNINPYDPATGLGVMSYPQIAQLVQQGYITPGTNALQSLYQNAITPEQAQQRWTQAWGDPNQQGSLANMYQTSLNNTMGYLTNAGEQASQDIANLYTQQGAAAQQDLASRGLANTTVLSSVQQGLTGQQAQDQARLQEQIGQMKAGYQSSLDAQANQAALGMISGGLGAYGDFYNQANQLGSQYAAYLQSAGDQMANYWGMAPAAVAGITSAYPTLADIYNLASQAGTGSTGLYALPGFNPSTIFGSNSGS